MIKIKITTPEIKVEYEHRESLLNSSAVETAIKILKDTVEASMKLKEQK